MHSWRGLAVILGVCFVWVLLSVVNLVGACSVLSSFVLCHVCEMVRPNK